MPLSDNLRGALFMIGSMTCFTINDAFMKTVGDDLPLFQALFVRGIGASLFLIGLTWALGQLHLHQSRRDWALMAIRAVAEMAGAWTFVTALFHMPFADLSAIIQAVPLSITLASALVLGEVVGWRRLTAILIGFGGVLMIVRPGGEGFTVYAIYALICVAMVTVRDISSRMMSASAPSLLVATTSAIGVTGFAGVGAVFVDWAPVSGGAAWGLTGSMLFLIGGYVFSVAAVRTGEISFVAPFRYTGLVVAILVGVVVFGTFPDGWTWAGAGIVVATGLFTLYREQVVRRAAARRVA